MSTTFFWVWGLSDAHFTKKNAITVHVSLWGKIQRIIRLQNYLICQNLQLVGEIVLFLPLFLMQCFFGQCRTPSPPRPFSIIITIVISCLFGKNKRAAEYHKRKERGCDSSVPELCPEMHSVRCMLISISDRLLKSACMELSASLDITPGQRNHTTRCPLLFLVFWQKIRTIYKRS